MFEFSHIAVIAAGFLLFCLIVKILMLRRIVPTNVVHIVQRAGETVSYGSGKTEGNVYYQWPAWLPIWGITVRILPVSNFDLDLTGYAAYDRDRVPFLVDVKAFFKIEDTNVAAQRVENFEELQDHLLGIVQGAVRSILAKSELERIMEERSIYGDAFTADIKDDLRAWGVTTLKPIELMDIKDSKESQVIENIMAKRKSGIEKESRIEVAKNKQLAAEAEISAEREVEIKKADAAKLTGEAQAKSEQAVGIAKQKSEQSIQEEAKLTAEKVMAVQQVNTVRSAEINKEAVLIEAEQERKKIEIEAEANKAQTQVTADAKKYEMEQLAEAALTQKKREAEGIKAVGLGQAESTKAIGLAEAEAEKQKQLASVTAQTTLAKEVGQNKEYQSYLVQIEQVKVSRDIGIEYAKSLSRADIKILANAGDVQSGLNKVTDIISTKGGSAINGLVEALKMTDTGKSLITGLVDKLNDTNSNK